MPLPTLPTGYQSGVYETLVRSLPGNWFHQLEKKTSPLYPLLWGLSGALGHVRLSYEKALQAAIPKTSGGPWLSLHLKSIGLTRTTAETDESARVRYEWEFHPTRNTRAGEYAALQHYLGLTAPTLRLESDRASNRYGQFRVVLESQTLPWSEVDYGFIGTFVRRYVTNGIIPGVDVNLQCLLVQSLKPWRFSDQFPMSWNIQGSIWERKSFVNSLRLPFARSTFAQVSAPEWRMSRDRLLQLYRDAKGDAPGAMFLYLSDEGQCPYLDAEYDLQLTSADVAQTFPARPFKVDGIHFYNDLPYIGAAAGTSVSAPYLEVPALIAPATSPLLPLPELFTLYAVFPGDTQSLNSAVVKYYGKKFSTLKITRFLPSAAASSDPEYSSPQLALMKSGPWTLILTMGDEAWGDFPPPGSTLTGTPFVELQPKSIWWTDASGNSRSWTALWDGDAIYLGMEFILPRSLSDRTIRECELRLNDARVEYRRFGLPVPSVINTGFMFRVKAAVTTSSDGSSSGTPPTVSLMGANLDSTKDWNARNPFKNLMITARPWQVSGQVWEQQNNLIVDADGWISNFNGNAYAETYVFADNSIPGDYVLLWDGAGSFSGGTLEVLTGFTVTSETAGRAVINIASANTNVGMRIKPVANMAQYTRNMRLVAIADELTFTDSPFNPAYLAMLNPFSQLRLMDFHGTNWNPMQNWSDRPTKNSFGQVGESANGLHPKGVAYEWGIDLCNAANKNLWVCVPHKATDGFVTNLASLIRDTLNPGLTVHIEYSNEVWNGQFSQSSYAVTQGVAQGLDGDSILSGFKFYGKRSREVWRIFRDVFGSANHGRLVRVFSGQGANPYVAEQGLLWQAANGGIEADVMAIAPYFDGQSPIPGGGAPFFGIPAGHYASWNGSSWVDLGTTNPGGTIIRTYNSQPPPSPFNGEKWQNDSNIMPIVRPPDWATTPELQAIWQASVLALSVDQIIAALQHDIANYRVSQINSNKTMLQGHGWNLPIVAYEGGQHLIANTFTGDSAQTTMTARFAQANNDIRIKAIVRDYLNMWKTLSGSQRFCWFNASSVWSKYGFWGLYNSSGAGGKTLKAEAVEEWVADNSAAPASSDLTNLSNSQSAPILKNFELL